MAKITAQNTIKFIAPIHNPMSVQIGILLPQLTKKPPRGGRVREVQIMLRKWLGTPRFRTVRLRVDGLIRK